MVRHRASLQTVTSKLGESSAHRGAEPTLVRQESDGGATCAAVGPEIPSEVPVNKTGWDEGPFAAALGRKWRG